jgi:ribosomal protein S18 acetylase RimI-like enzyme
VPTIRPYRPGDHAAVHEICIATADAGHDARPHFREPDLYPETFAHPYTALEPGLAFVLDDGGEAVGYVVGTADTVRFVKRVRDEWLPRVRDRFPERPGVPATPEDGIRHLLHHPEHRFVPGLDLDAYPAHLHIDLLPPYQRAGHGRALMETEFAALRAAGAPALHIGLLTVNTSARGFYDRLGCHVIDVPDAGPVTYLGFRL